MHLADAFIQSDLQLHSGYTFFVSIHQSSNSSLSAAFSVFRENSRRQADPRSPLMSYPLSCFQHSSGSSVFFAAGHLLCCGVVSPQWPQSHPSLLSAARLSSLSINISLLVASSFLLPASLISAIFHMHHLF